MDGWTDGRMDRRTDMTSYRDAQSHLKRGKKREVKNKAEKKEEKEKDEGREKKE